VSPCVTNRPLWVKQACVQSPADRVAAVVDQDHRLPPFLEFVDLLVAFLDEVLVAHRQDLVEQQDVGVEKRGHREAQARGHAGGVVLERRVDEGLQPGESNDFGINLPRFGIRQAEDGGVEVDVLLAGQFRVEPKPQPDERHDPAVRADVSARGPVNAGDQTQQRALAGAIAWSFSLSVYLPISFLSCLPYVNTGIYTIPFPGSRRIQERMESQDRPAHP